MNPRIFQLVLSGLMMAPGIISHVNDVLHGGATKRDKALELVSTGLSTLDTVAPQVRLDPGFQSLIAKANDAIYEAAKYGAVLSAGASVPQATPGVDGHPGDPIVQ